MRKYVIGILSILFCAVIVASNPAQTQAASQSDRQAYRAVFDADYYYDANPDVAAACGRDAEALFDHFVSFGLKEGRSASAVFNPFAYRARYTDLQKAFGYDMAEYCRHYVSFGIAEGRDASSDGKAYVPAEAVKAMEAAEKASTMESTEKTVAADKTEKSAAGSSDTTKSTVTNNDTSNTAEATTTTKSTDKTTTAANAATDKNEKAAASSSDTTKTTTTANTATTDKTDRAAETTKSTVTNNSTTKTAAAGTTDGDVKKNDTANVTSGTGEVIGTYITYYEDDIPRAINVELAAERINSVVVQPGETFSFSQTVLPRTSANGYVDAEVFVSGKRAIGIGGGICQVSSTLYAAMVDAGLPATERYAHSLEVDYVPAELDATIAGDYKDLKFKNIYAQPLLIQASAEDGVVTVTLILQ